MVGGASVQQQQSTGGREERDAVTWATRREIDRRSTLMYVRVCVCGDRGGRAVERLHPRPRVLGCGCGERVAYGALIIAEIGANEREMG